MCLHGCDCVWDSTLTTEFIIWLLLEMNNDVRHGVAAMMIAASTPTSAKMISATKIQLFFSQCRCFEPMRFPTLLSSQRLLSPSLPMRLSAFFFFTSLETRESAGGAALLFAGRSSTSTASLAASPASVGALFFIHELSALAFGMTSAVPEDLSLSPTAERKDYPWYILGLVERSI